MATSRRAPSRGRAAPPGEEEAGSGVARGARVRASGLGVAAKFSLVASLVLAGAMLVFTPVVYVTVSKTLSREIDDAGVLAVTVMSCVSPSAWHPYEDTPAEGKEGELVLGEEEKAILKARSEINRRRVAQIADAAGSKVLDAVVLTEDKRNVVNGRAMKFEPTGPSVEAGDGVTVERGRYEAQSGAKNARLYQRAIRDYDGKVAAWAGVALSEEKIDSVLGRLLGTLSLLAVMFTGLGLLVAWFAGQRVMRPVALLTADIEAVAAGDLAHRTFPHSTDEIGAVARSFDRMTQNLFAAQELERKQAAQEHQIEIARQVQAALFPADLPTFAGFESAAAATTAEKVGGSYYDLVRCADGAPMFVLASASSEGVPGAMVAIMSRSLIKSVAVHESSPAEILRKVNAFLAPDLRRGLFVTVLLAKIDGESGRVITANAGHHPLLVCRPGAKTAEPVTSDGIALGFDKGPIFDRRIQDLELALEKGTRLVLCTKSVFEVENAAGEEIGEERVYATLAREAPKHSQVFVPMVMHTVNEHAGGAAHGEDIAIVTVRRMA